MSDEPVNEEAVVDVDEDEEAEVEGHVMFAEKKGFSVIPDSPRKNRQSSLPRETRAPICSRSAGSSARSSSAMRNCTSRKRALTERNSSVSLPRGESADAAA
jgi:hypothetical protein